LRLREDKKEGNEAKEEANKPVANWEDLNRVEPRRKPCFFFNFWVLNSFGRGVISFFLSFLRFFLLKKVDGAGEGGFFGDMVENQSLEKIR